jgi:hypothetical protein
MDQPKQPTINRRLVSKRIPESARQSFAKVVLSIISLILTIYIAYIYKHTCGNDWMYAILKSFGINCLGMVLLSALTWPMMYWDQTSRARGAKGPTVARKVADVLSPWNASGWAIQIGITIMLFIIFTRDCEMTSSLGLSPMTMSPSTF